jgi:endonuclease III
MTSISFASVVSALRTRYGPPADMPPRAVRGDPFALVLWEQVAYLATDAKRLQAFSRLSVEVGLTPDDILDAPPAVLESVCRSGGSIAAEDRAERMRMSARLIKSAFDGDARAILAMDEDAARRAVAKFPMLGEPGADKLLALCGVGSRLPLDSNGLRVVTRLGWVAPLKDYRATYRAAQSAIERPQDTSALVDAGALLRMHGLETCRRNSPACERCPLHADCPAAGQSAATNSAW